jgi:DNA polymerase II small subunit/DNA polymerase delta subunit B
MKVSTPAPYVMGVQPESTLMTLRQQIVAAYRSAANDHERRALLAEVTAALDDVWGTSKAATEFKDLDPKLADRIRRLSDSLRGELDELLLAGQATAASPIYDGQVTGIVGHAVQLSTALDLQYDRLQEGLKRYRTERRTP